MNPFACKKIFDCGFHACRMLSLENLFLIEFLIGA